MQGTQMTTSTDTVVLVYIHIQPCMSVNAWATAFWTSYSFCTLFKGSPK